MGPRPGYELRRGWTEEKEEEEEEKKKEKFPLCVKAKVIGPFGAAAQKAEILAFKLKIRT